MFWIHALCTGTWKRLIWYTLPANLILILLSRMATCSSHAPSSYKTQHRVIFLAGFYYQENGRSNGFTGHSFFADPDPADFLMWIRIQLNKICNKSPYAEYSGVEKDQQDCSKARNHGADANLLTIQTNFLASFCIFSNIFLKFFFSQIFLFWIRMRILNADPDP